MFINTAGPGTVPRPTPVKDSPRRKEPTPNKKR